MLSFLVSRPGRVRVNSHEAVEDETNAKAPRLPDQAIASRSAATERDRDRRMAGPRARAEGAPPPPPDCIALAKFLRYHKDLKNRAGVLNGKRVEFFKGTPDCSAHGGG